MCQRKANTALTQKRRAAKPKSNCAVYLFMEMITQTHPDMERRQRREADATDDTADIEGASAGPADLYDMLGYRGTGGTVTTQQWLALRCLSF